MYGDDSTTAEWTDLTKEGFWGGSLLGLTESLPAMLGNMSWTGWAQRTALMYAQVSDHLMEEMQNDPDFANISENEKMAVTVPIGMVVATLEAVGLRNIINKGGLINSIVLKSLAKSPKGKLGSQTFGETVQKEVKSRIARGMLITGAAGAAEFETGFLQEGADIGGKHIYNAIKEKEMFETPSDFRSIMAQMLRGGAQEAVGGLVLGTPGGIVAGATNYDFTKVDDATWKMFEEINKSEKSHSDYFTFFVQDIKNKILNGKMTKKEGDAILNQFNKISGVYNQLPTDLNSDQKRKVLGLLLRKQELQEQTANKDKTLVKKQLAEIAEIDAKMESILQAEVATETETETTVTPEGKGVEVTTETDTQTDTQQDQLTQEQADIDTFFGEDVSDSQISVDENIVINNGKQGPQGQDLNTFTETLSDLQKTALNFAKTSLKAISTIAPNVKIVFHQNQNDYNAATGTKPGVLSRGSFDINTGLIHINLPKVKATTVPHEVFHAVIMNLTKTDAESSALTKKMMEAVRKGLTAGQQSLLNKIEAHASQGYDTDMIAEEELAELFGILASEYKNLNKPQKSAVLSWIKSMGQKMGFSMDFINQLTKDEEAVIDLMNTLATKVREGEVIQKSDVDVITGGRVRKKEATTKKEETTKKEKPKQKKEKETKKPKRKTKEQKAPKDLTFDEYVKRQTRNQKEETASEVFNLEELEVISKGGTGRIVYQHPTDKNKVIKVATSPRGLEQNLSVGFGDFNMLDGKIAELFEQGLDYIVVEKVPRNDKVVNKYLKGLKSAYRENGVDRFGNVAPIVQEIMQDKGLIDFLNYNILWGDFLATRNWGVRKDGEVVLVDEGALNDKVFYGSKIEEWAQKEWQEVKNRKRKDRETRKIRNQIAKDVKQWKMEETDMDAMSQEAIKNFRPQGRKEGSLSSQLRQGEKQHFEIQRKIKEAIKRGKLKYSFDETPGELRVWIHSDGQPLGMVRATKVGGQRINYAGLEKALMGTGVGKTMYSLAQQYIMDNWVDKTLHSDYFMTHDAHNLWKSFVRRGLAESYVTKKGKTRYAMKPVTRKIRQQLDLFEDQEQEFSPSEFFESKIKEFKGDKYKAALATQEEVNRREQALQQPVKETKPTRTIEQVMTYFNMNPQGFIDKQNTVEYVQRFLPEGYKAHRAKMTYDGYGGGIYITKNGRRIKPTTPKRKTRLQKDMVVPNSGGRTILDYFVEGLENNFSRDMITDYLVRRKGLRVKDIKEFLKISKSDTKLLQSIKLLPKSFGNIKGGIKAGISLYNKVMNFRDNLIQKNKEGKLKRKLSEAEINQKTMEFLEAQPEYQQEADTYKKGKETKSRKGLSSQQALMQVELQKQFGKRPTREVGRKLRKLKFMLQNIGRGRRSLIQLKREVRNFMRMALPPGLYTKPEVLKLVRKLDQATEQNIDNILSEITDLAVKKNIQILNKELTNLLQGKYEQTVGGRKRGYKVDSRAKEILNKIKKAFQGTRNSTAVDIAADNTKLQARYDELAQQNTLTEAEIDEMSSLQIMIELNNSRLMGDNNVHKLTSLSTVVEQLADIVLGGKQRLNESIKAQHKEYRRQFSEAFYDMTGVKLPMQELEFAEQQYENSPTEENQAKLEEAQKLYDETINKNRREVNQKNNRQHVASRVKKLMGGILNSIGNVFHSHEALDGLMDKISMLPGKMFEGKMQTLVTERIDAASREFKGRKLAVEKMLQDKMKEIFGKKWKQIMVKNRNITNTGIFLNKKEVDKAQAEYDANPTKENLKKLNKIKADNELLLSQEQMYYYYNQYKDPANEGTFEAMYGPEYKRIMEEMTNQLTPETKAFADWQVDILFPSLYEHYNTTYQDIYRTNMPYNEHYAGKMYRDTEMKPLDLLGGNITGTSVGASSTLERTQNNNPLQKMNGTDVLLTYINDMEYFSAYAVPVRDINKIFDNPIIKNTIKDTHGNLTNTLINDAIKKIANKGVRTDLTNFAISHMNDVFILSRLGINPVVMLKQLTSFITYANDIGFVNYAKYGMKNIMQVKKTWKEIRDNSVYMQDRKNNGIMKAIESYSEKNMQEFVPTWFGSESIGAQKQFLIDFLMFTTKFGDRTAIMMGGMPNYLYYKAEFQKKNPKATEQQVIDYAIRRFERDTKRTQQSGDLQDKDIMQTGNPVVRALNMFMTTPKQYLRKEIQGFRNLGRKIAAMDTKAGKGTVWQNLRTIGMYHVVMPVFFQWVALGMPGMLRGVEDDDKEDLARAAILGNLNALFILGEAFNMAADFFTGKPYAGQNVKSVGILNIASRLTTMAKRADAAKDPAKQEELWMKFYLELSTLSGMPVPQVKRLWDNYSKLYSEDMPPGEAIMRLFNYSEWQIEGGRPDKKKSTKPIKLRKNELKEYHPDLYELKYGDMDGEFEEFEELENEMKEEQKLMRQEMLEELYD